LVGGRVVVGPPSSLGQRAQGRLDLRSRDHRNRRRWRLRHLRHRRGAGADAESQTELQGNGQGQRPVGRHYRARPGEASGGGDRVDPLVEQGRERSGEQLAAEAPGGPGKGLGGQVGHDSRDPRAFVGDPVDLGLVHGQGPGVAAAGQDLPGRVASGHTGVVQGDGLPLVVVDRGARGAGCGVGVVVHELFQDINQLVVAQGRGPWAARPDAG